MITNIAVLIILSSFSLNLTCLGEIHASTPHEQVACAHDLDRFNFPVTEIKGDITVAAEQFAEVNRLQPPDDTLKIPSDIASQYAEKNRPAGILPNVRNLITTENVEYLNGNLIEAPSFSSHTYIAMQAPKQETVADMFQVFIDKNSKLLLSLVMERQIHRIHGEVERCFNFWDQPIDLGNGMIVTQEEKRTIKSLTNEKQLIIIRELTLTKENTSRKITHIHYQHWPDHGAPDPDLFFEFNELVNTQIEEDLQNDQEHPVGPLAVHCHAGSGRAGTFIVTQFIRDYIQAELKSGKQLDEITINIPKLVIEVRSYRDLVEKEVQYNAILEWTERYVRSLQRAS